MREWRGVYLLADEAERLNSDATGERFACCPHLDVFHNQGEREDGSRWRACQFWRCNCVEDVAPSASRVACVAAEREYARAERRHVFFMTLLFGMSIGIAGAWMVMR